MAKTESTLKNMLVTLFLVSFISATALAYVYELTKGPKAQAELQKKLEAIKRVVPGFDNDPDKDAKALDIDGDKVVFYPARKDGKLVGTAIETFSDKGFGGKVRLMVGLLPNGSIYDIAVIDHRETPGLGDKMERAKSPFSLQFKGKDPATFTLTIKKDGGDVDGITAATYSSRAFCDAVKRAYDAYEKEGIK